MVFTALSVINWCWNYPFLIHDGKHNLHINFIILTNQNMVSGNIFGTISVWMDLSSYMINVFSLKCNGKCRSFWGVLRTSMVPPIRVTSRFYDRESQSRTISIFIDGRYFPVQKYQKLFLKILTGCLCHRLSLLYLYKQSLVGCQILKFRKRYAHFLGVMNWSWRDFKNLIETQFIYNDGIVTGVSNNFKIDLFKI